MISQLINRNIIGGNNKPCSDRRAPSWALTQHLTKNCRKAEQLQPSLNVYPSNFNYTFKVNPCEKTLFLSWMISQIPLSSSLYRCLFFVPCISTLDFKCLTVNFFLSSLSTPCCVFLHWTLMLSLSNRKFFFH